MAGFGVACRRPRARYSNLADRCVVALEQSGYSLSRHVQDGGDVPAGQAFLLQMVGSFLIVSRTTPGDTMRASTITAMCFPHGRYHFW